MSLLLVQKYHLVTYNNQYWNEFVIHIPHQPTFNITKAGFFYHIMMYLLKHKKNTHIMVNDSRYPIPQVEEKKKQYTYLDIKRDYCARWFHHINGQPIKLILHAVDNNILHNLPILREYVGMAEEIYGPSVPRLQGKTVHHNI